MRLSALDEANLEPEQAAVLNQLRSGPRGAGAGLFGPFGVWVRAPSVGGSVQALGSAIRFESQLDDKVREVAICTVGHHYRARFEFAAHRDIGVAAGVDPDALERLRLDQPPGFNGREDLAYRVAKSMLEDHRLNDALYSEAIEVLGETNLIELVTTIGYYCLVSHTLNVFEVPLRDRY